ncbi:MAG: GH116 family glycosyl hydrolase [Phycisphaerales bacterium]
MSNDASSCCGDGCPCGPRTTIARPPDAALARREFLGSIAMGGAALMAAASSRAIAGPFVLALLDDYPIPADKRFSSAWLRSLVARGEPQWYTSADDELKHIGMPVGGLCAGQVYLGGDGRLWHWDILNLPPSDEFRSTAGPHYARPAQQRSPFVQGFALEVRDGDATRRRTLDAKGFASVRFRGEYPIGRVEYRDDACPVEVDLAAFAPFCPLDAELSETPATIVRCTLRNRSANPIDATLAGFLENAVCLKSGIAGTGERRTQAVVEGNATALVMDALPQPVSTRPDVTVADFESGTYQGWSSTGDAFGKRPRTKDDIKDYQGDVNMQGRYTANTHETRNGEDVTQADRHIGTLTSEPFKLERDWLRFRIGGGNHSGQTCVNLLVDGAPVRTATGHNNNRMRLDHFDVREFVGREARIQLVDAWTGSWGQIGADDFVLTDSPMLEPMADAPDFGTMALAAIGATACSAAPAVGAGDPGERVFAAPAAAEARLPFGAPLVGGLRVPVRLGPGAETTVTFAIAWHFPRTSWDALPLPDADRLRRGYARRFADVRDVVRAVASRIDDIVKVTALWRDTWYDSTLPYWLLDRTFANLSTLATATCLHLTDDGSAAAPLDRFYAWEGTYCCAGTCQHVWQYAQAVARVFPSLERNVREVVDFGLAWHDSGAIDYRAEADRRVAHDGLAGTIVRAWREHTMCADDAYLRRIWPKAKASVEYLMREDRDQDGILEGAQYNTLDTTWYGPMAWISSLYLAALRAGEAMALEMGDEEFAKRCGALVDKGSRKLVATLFNGEWFVHQVDAAHPEANNTNDGCHIDQVFGQSLAWQAGLSRVVPQAECATALRSLYTYSFAPDIGPYRQRFDGALPGGRWYAMPGEGGLLMCTWPPPKAEGGERKARGKGGDAWAAGYFVECMSGFEHQVAAHMIWEGLVEEGLAIERMIHDRYHAAKRNPYNEVECSDHYARAMASYAVYQAACGFSYHGPKAHIEFAPRLTPNDFRCAFVAAQGWGSYAQRIAADAMQASLDVRYGTLTLRTVALELPAGQRGTSVRVTVDDRDAPATLTMDGRRCTIDLGPAIEISRGVRVSVTLA